MNSTDGGYEPGGVDDPDAMWRRGVVTEAVRFAPPAVDTRSSIAEGSGARRVDDALVSPWSRRAAAQPRARRSAERDREMRQRWRRELGLDRTEASEARNPPDSIQPERSSPFVVADAPPSTVAGDLVLGAILVALVLAAAFTTVLLLIPGGDGRVASEPTAVRLAPTADLRWTIDLAAPRFDVATDGDVVIVQTADDITAYDARRGGRRWRVPMDGEVISAKVAVIEHVVVVIERSSDARVAGRALDAVTGEQLWSRDGAGTALEVVVGVDGRPTTLIETRSGQPAMVHSIDVRTGAVAGRGYDLSPISTTPDYIAVRSGSRVSLIELASDEDVGPAVDPFELATLVPVGDGAIGFRLDSDLIAFDSAGEATDQVQFVSDAFGDFPGRARLLGAVPDSDVVIVSSGSSIGVELVGGRLHVVWDVAGRVGPPIVTERGPTSVGRLVDTTTGEINMAIVDPLTGATVALTDEGLTREQDPVVADVGFVVAPAIGAAERRVEAIAFDGSPIWSVPLPNQATFVLADGVVVVVDRSERPSISVYG